MSDPLAGLRPEPIPTNITQQFWDAARNEEFLLQYCTETGKAQFFPRPVSVFTGGRALEWRKSSGKGEVYSFTVTRRGPPPFRDVGPYIIATIELDEGVRVMSNVIDCEPEDIAIGMKVELAWAEAGDYKFPVFRPAG
jgi:uncharacterized OB-fold protein